MKKKRQKKSIVVSNSRWLAYATAGAATALSAVTSAEAEIHYSEILDIRFKDPQTHVERHVFPLSGEANLIFIRDPGGSYYVLGLAGIRGGAVSNSLRLSSRPPYYLSRLGSGENVSAGLFVEVGIFRRLFGIYNSGNFATPGEGFVGFKFNNGNGPQYGWARLEMGKYPRHNFELVDYAWGDPGDIILTGQTSSDGNQITKVPDSGSLGLLALGGAGLVAWRKRRYKVATAEIS